MSLFSGVIEKKRRADQWLKDHPLVLVVIVVAGLVQLGFAMRDLAEIEADFSAGRASVAISEDNYRMVGELRRGKEEAERLLADIAAMEVDLRCRRGSPGDRCHGVMVNVVSIEDRIGRIIDHLNGNNPRPFQEWGIPVPIRPSE